MAIATPPNQELVTRAGTPAHLRSEDVIIEAPFSFVGSTKRIMRAMMPWVNRTNEELAQAREAGEKTVGKTFSVIGSHATLVLALVGAWLGVLCWYALFGLLLVPYRLIRRSQRKNERNRLQHEELMAAMTVAARKQD